MTEFEHDLLQQREKVSKATNLAIGHVKSHFIDYLLIFLICLILGILDSFILGRSDNLFSADYWYHAICRISAFALASILGIRVGYPKAKESSILLQEALERNKALLKLREGDFDTYIYNVNMQNKIEAWKNIIYQKLNALEKRSEPYFSMYYKKASDEYFSNLSKKQKQLAKKRAENYVKKRTHLEHLLTDEYINENIESLNVKYYRIYEMDFDLFGESRGANAHVKTRSSLKSNTAQTVASGLMVTLIITLVLGSITLSFNADIFENKIAGIILMVINAVFDIGMTLFRYANGYLDSGRIVMQEDIQPCINRNRLLTKYCSQKNIPIPSFKDKELKNLEE